jgi:hypothetical protein
MLFFQGLVQISVGCYNLISINKNEPISQFKKEMTKLINYLPANGNMNLEILLGNIEIFIKSLTEDASITINVF